MARNSVGPPFRIAKTRMARADFGTLAERAKASGLSVEQAVRRAIDEWVERAPHGEDGGAG